MLVGTARSSLRPPFGVLAPALARPGRCAHPEIVTPPTPIAPYREAGAERRALVCPLCSGPGLTETEESAICSRCDTRFSTREATSAIEQAAIQRFAQSLAPLPAQRGLTQAGRWGVTAAIIGCLVVAGLLAGAIGVAIGGIAVGALFAVAMRKSDPYSR
jgi:hypothetical protein